MNTCISFALIVACLLVAAASAYPAPSPTPNEVAELGENARRLIYESEFEENGRVKRSSTYGDVEIDEKGGIGRYVIMNNTLLYVYRRNGVESWVWKEGDSFKYLAFRIRD